MSTQACRRRTYGLLEVDLVVENGHFLDLLLHGNGGINAEQRGVQRRHGPLTTAARVKVQRRGSKWRGTGLRVFPYLTLSGKN